MPSSPGNPAARSAFCDSVVCDENSTHSLPSQPGEAIRRRRPQRDDEDDGEEEGEVEDGEAAAGTAAGFFVPASMIDWPEKMAPLFTISDRQVRLPSTRAVEVSSIVPVATTLPL